MLTLFSLFVISRAIYSEVPVQFIEVKGRNGNVTLHTGMPKDSVEILIGKPDDIDLYESLGKYREKWGYKLKNDYTASLVINFEDGELKGIRQN